MNGFSLGQVGREGGGLSLGQVHIFSLFVGSPLPPSLPPSLPPLLLSLLIYFTYYHTFHVYIYITPPSLPPSLPIGISQRRILPSGGQIRGLAATAAARALESAGLEGKDIDLVILATSSPDDLFGDATSVAAAVGATGAVAFDLTAACSGFLFGVVSASQFLHSGCYKNALVVGADALSRWVDWEDRNSCILFGDGAGAVVLTAAEGEADSGLLGFAMHSDGTGEGGREGGREGGVDWEDRNSCVLFGDGAGAVVLTAAEGEADSGLLGFAMHSDGRG